MFCHGVDLFRNKPYIEFVRERIPYVNEKDEALVFVIHGRTIMRFTILDKTFRDKTFFTF